MSIQVRHSAGTSVGGQFATQVLAEVPLDSDLVASARPNWRDWWPEPVGTEPIEADSWTAAAEEPTWVEAYNATPAAERRPLELIHGSQSRELTLKGAVHFGDLCTAMDRLNNTTEDLEGAYIHTYEWRGDLNPMVMPDTVANAVLHPESPTGDAWGAQFEFEVSEVYDGDPEDYLDEATAAVRDNPDAAVLYVNNTEGTGDGERISMGVQATSPHLRYAGSRSVCDDDYEYISH